MISSEHTDRDPEESAAQLEHLAALAIKAIVLGGAGGANASPAAICVAAEVGIKAELTPAPPLISIVCVSLRAFPAELCPFLVRLAEEGISGVQERAAKVMLAVIEDMVAGATPFIPRNCLLYTSPSPRDGLLSRMPSSA